MIACTHASTHMLAALRLGRREQQLERNEVVKSLDKLRLAFKKSFPKFLVKASLAKS